MKETIAGQDDYSTILNKLKSPEGQRLLELLQASDLPERKTAMAQAAKGDFTGAKQIAESILSNPEAAALLQKLRGE